MPLPQKTRYDGQTATLSLGEFRAAPGEALERVMLGMEITLTKRGKPIAILSPPETVIDRKGNITSGRKPLTFGIDLGGEYAFGLTHLVEPRMRRRMPIY